MDVLDTFVAVGLAAWLVDGVLLAVTDEEAETPADVETPEADTLPAKVDELDTNADCALGCVGLGEGDWNVFDAIGCE